MPRRGKESKDRASSPESEHEKSDSGEDEEVDFGAHAVVKVVEGQLVQETIPIELIQEMRYYGNSSKEGLWDPVKISLDGKNITITKPNLANMSDEEVSKIIKHLLCAAGYNYNPCNNSEGPIFTGYASVYGLKKLGKVRDRTTTVVVDDESIDHVISFPNTTSKNRQSYAVEAGNNQLMEFCEKAGISATMTAQLQTIMQNLMQSVPDLDFQHKQEKRRVKTTVATMHRYMGAVSKAKQTVGALARKGQAQVDKEKEKEDVYKRTKSLYVQFVQDSREATKAAEISAHLGIALGNAYRLVETALKKIDTVADKVTPATGPVPNAGMSVDRLRGLEMELQAKTNALSLYHNDARDYNKKVDRAFSEIAAKMRDLDKQCKRTNWSQTSSNALMKANSGLQLLQSEGQCVANEVSRASKTESGLSKALSSIANLLGGGVRVQPAADAEAVNSRGEGSNDNDTRDKANKKRKADTAEQVEGGGVASKAARRSSRRGQ
jgi:hypothetical protein